MFTDVWLFDRLLGPQGKPANPALVEKWLEHLKMTHKLELNDGRILNLKLSKGQKRIALLLALAEERDIILLDEAADQDPHFRREFYQVLLPLMQEMGKTIFAISHDDHYFIHADRLLEMRNGQLTELTGDERDAPRVMRLRVLRNGLWRRMNHLMAALRSHAGRPDKMPRVATRHRGIFAADERGSRRVLKRTPERCVSRRVQMPGKCDRAA